MPQDKDFFAVPKPSPADRDKNQAVKVPGPADSDKNKALPKPTPTFGIGKKDMSPIGPMINDKGQ